MKKVLFRGPCLSASGYGVHARQIARWLLSRDNIELTILPVQWGCTPWYLAPEAKGGLIGQLMQHSKQFEGNADISIQLQLPNEWDPKLASVNVGMTAGVETDVCNPAWIDAVKKMDRVIVPSTHVEKTFQRTASINNLGHLDNLSVVPESFPDSLLNVQKLNSTGFDFDTAFNFLMVGQLTGQHSVTDRKNVFNTVKWFCEEFDGCDDVGLVIKTNSGRDTKIDRKITIDLFNKLLREVRGDKKLPKIHLLHGLMNDNELSMLYHHPSIKAFLSLTRGEGFGLPLLEAAAAGLPTIATNWSAHLDFLSLGRFIKIDFALVEIDPRRVDNKIFMKGARWAEVKESDVKRKLRKFYERSDVPQEWAADLSKKIMANFDYTRIAAEYDAALGDLV